MNYYLKINNNYYELNSFLEYENVNLFKFFYNENDKLKFNKEIDKIEIIRLGNTVSSITDYYSINIYSTGVFKKNNITEKEVCGLYKSKDFTIIDNDQNKFLKIEIEKNIISQEFI